MEQQTITNQQLQARHKRDTLLAPVFLHFLEKNNVNTKDIVVLNVECSTGVLSTKLAEKSDRVYGFDQNKDVINFAREQYKHLKKLSFEHCHPESFTSPRLFNLAIIDSYIDNIDDKTMMFQLINNCLPSQNSELFITISTSDNKPHPSIITARKMIPDILKIIPYLTEEEITNLILPEYPSIQEVNTMLEESGFEIIKSEVQSANLLLTEKELLDLYTSTITNIPIFELIPDDYKENFTKEYTQKYILNLQKHANTKLMEPIITTVIHARKIKNS